jgi:hypothetical protein
MFYVFVSLVDFLIIDPTKLLVHFFGSTLPVLLTLTQSNAKIAYSEFRKLINRDESQATYMTTYILRPYINQCLRESEYTLAERAIKLLEKEYGIAADGQIGSVRQNMKDYIVRSQSETQ